MAQHAMQQLALRTSVGRCNVAVCTINAADQRTMLRAATPHPRKVELRLLETAFRLHFQIEATSNPDFAWHVSLSWPLGFADVLLPSERAWWPSGECCQPSARNALHNCCTESACREPYTEVLTFRQPNLEGVRSRSVALQVPLWESPSRGMPPKSTVRWPLSPMEARRVAAVGLPLALISAILTWGVTNAVLPDAPDLDAVEFFAGCESWSNALRQDGLNVCPSFQPATCLPAAGSGGRKRLPVSCAGCRFLSERH